MIACNERIEPTRREKRFYGVQKSRAYPRGTSIYKGARS